MSIKTISLKELFSSSRTKNGLTKLLLEALLKHYEGSSKKYVVSYHTYTKVNLPHTLEVDFQEHGHEEADTLIPLHAIDCIQENTFRDVHVHFPENDDEIVDCFCKLGQQELS